MATRRARRASEAPPTLALADPGFVPLPPEGACGDVERAFAAHDQAHVIGVDEAGRGPLAGPVVVAAVLLPTDDLARWDGLTDSKKLDEHARDRFFDLVRQHALAWQIVEVDVDVIDRLNILGATLYGMRRSVEAVHAMAPAHRHTPVLVDGNQTIPALQVTQRTIVHGDARSYAIAAASVLAKVYRDRRMQALDARHPGYGFAKHKGYGTAQHLAALRQLGATDAHRRTFAPVRDVLQAANDARATENDASQG